mmetsp:Transcript_7334/g.26077  ORF Transcript_7334/g.26077 Transcript_7334/m.26077 type:complete len:183 (-) Transcript_7334:1409-1957(-)
MQCLFVETCCTVQRANTRACKCVCGSCARDHRFDCACPLRAASAYEHAYSTFIQGGMALSSASSTLVAILQTMRRPRVVLPTCSASRMSSSLVSDTSAKFKTMMIHLMSFIRQCSCVKEAFQPSMVRIDRRNTRDGFLNQQKQRNCPTHTQWNRGAEQDFLRCTRALMQSLEILPSIFDPAR